MIAAIQATGSFMAVLSFGLVLEVPGEYLGWFGLTSGVCWLVHLLVKAGSGSTILGALLASLFVAPMGHLFTGASRAPVSISLMSGILPLALSTSVYNSVCYVARNNGGEPTHYLVEAFQIMGIIAPVMFLMDSVFRLVGKEKKVEM